MLNNLPNELEQVINDAVWTQITDGSSAAEVYHLVLPEEQQVSGFIDLGAMGVGDPYVDLALTQRSIIYKSGRRMG